MNYINTDNDNVIPSTVKTIMKRKTILTIIQKSWSMLIHKRGLDYQLWVPKLKITLLF